MNDILTIHTKDSNWFNELFSIDRPEDKSVQICDEIYVEHISSKEIGKGFGSTELAITIGVSILTNVTAGILVNIIYEKIMNSGRNKIVQKEKKITIVTKEELVEYIENTYYK